MTHTQLNEKTFLNTFDSHVFHLVHLVSWFFVRMRSVNLSQLAIIAQHALHILLLQCFHSLHGGLPPYTYRLNPIFVDLFEFSNLAYLHAKCQPIHTSVLVR
jgi:hypothetical protein